MILMNSESASTLPSLSLLQVSEINVVPVATQVRLVALVSCITLDGCLVIITSGKSDINELE